MCNVFLRRISECSFPETYCNLQLFLQNMQQMFKICRKRCCDFHIMTINRMRKTNRHSMQSLPLQMKSFLPVTINGVSQQRMSDGTHMYPDLVSTASLQTTFNISIFLKTLQNSVMCHRRFAVLFCPMTPCTIARYLRVIVCSFSWAAISRWAWSFLQTIREPVVS